MRGEATQKRIIGIDKGPLLIGFRGRHHRHICFLFTPALCNCRGMIFPAHSLPRCACMLFLNGNFFKSRHFCVNFDDLSIIAQAVLSFCLFLSIGSKLRSVEMKRCSINEFLRAFATTTRRTILSIVIRVLFRRN